LVSLGLSVATLLVAPRLFPVPAHINASSRTSLPELALRMAAGAVLTVSVTLAADAIGSGWSGLLAVFPVLSIVLAVSSHRESGPALACALLRAMATGLYSLIAFCATLALAMPAMSLPAAFGTAIAACLAAQVATMKRIPARQ
jgi:uncharacterized membrane protein (GlpM family)